MMLFVGILMLYISGAAVLMRISSAFCWKEIISYSLPIGFAINTLFMFLFDVIGFGFSQYALFFGSFAVIALNYDLLYNYYQNNRKYIKLPSLSLSGMNFTAVFLLLVILTLFYIITSKNLFWPTSEHDSIASFDKLGMVMALEGRVRISLFDYGLQGAGGIYPPLFHGGIAYLYLFGASSPKIITTLFYISLTLGFYTLVKKYVSPIMALFFTLLLAIVPELYSHAALLLGNLPTTTNVMIAALTLFVAIDTKQKNYLWLSAIFIAIALWTRNDTIGFGIAAVAIVFFNFYKEKDWKTIGVYAAVSLSTFILWTLYLKFFIAIPQSSVFVDYFGFDGQKLETMLLYVITMFTWLQYGTMPPGHLLYGVSFMLPIIFILLNVRNIKTDKPYVLVFFLLSFAIYFTIFYLIDESKQGAPISSLMESSFKRGMFCFIPILLFYSATCKTGKWISDKIEAFRLG
jgi:hypothetical protein